MSSLSDGKTYSSRRSLAKEKGENQMNLLDIIASEEAKREAIARVGRNMNPDWAELVDQAIMLVLSKRREFTTDDVWDELDGTIEPHEKRAMGAAMLRVARKGLIHATDRTMPSARAVCHANPKRIWMVVDNGPTTH